MAINFSDLGGGGGGKFQKTEIITATQSWTVPADVDQIEVWAFGGGGAGGGWYDTSNARPGGGGGGGGCGHKILNVTPGASYTVTIGAGGAAVAQHSWPAAQGSITSFGSLVYGYGGLGGTPQAFSEPQYNQFLGQMSSTGPAGSGGGGGGPATSTSNFSAAGGGGGAGGNAFQSGTFTATNGNSYLARQAYGQGFTGAHAYGVLSSQSWTYGWSGNGGRGIFGYGGGGGGALTSNDFSGTWSYVLPSLRYVGNGVDGGGDGARAIYSEGAVGAGSHRVATSAGANTAGGGGGGAKNNWATYNPGNGGSGVVVIKYWTAG